jgi:hypothetical protein
MLRILVSVATYNGILNTIITILYSHRQGRNTSIHTQTRDCMLGDGSKERKEVMG